MPIPNSDIIGEGLDDDGHRFDLRFKFVDLSEQLTEWYGQIIYEGQKENVRFNVDGNDLDYGFIRGAGVDNYGQYSLEGSVDREKNTFECIAKYESFQISFKGQTDSDLMEFKGVCEDQNQQGVIGNFFFRR